MSDSANSCTIIIFGATGDLATRMLFPSLYYLDRDGYLPQNLRIAGSARNEMDEGSFRQLVQEKLQQYLPADQFETKAWSKFAARLSYAAVDAEKPESFRVLAQALKLSPQAELVCYLATSPKLYGAICHNLKEAGLVGAHTRVVMEKPIGHNLASSKVINDAVAKIFPESHIFRIDHYLGKETVQNLLALRFANTIFEPLWDSGQIDHVQIMVSETVGVEGRWSYYNDSGALRDMLQNHMLQLLALIAMEPPSDFDPDAVRNEKVKVLRSLRPILGKEVQTDTVRGQYTAGAVNGKPVPGYQQESGGQPGSTTETFVALRAHIDNWRWAGVPFYLRTGKRLATRRSEIYIQFRQVPHSIFAKLGVPELSPNKLVIQLQPEEDIQLLLMNKVPGLNQKGIKLRELPLNLGQDGSANTRRRIAYERLFLDIIRNDTTLFVRRDEVEAAWTWADGILQAWQDSQEKPKPYPAGSWGPTASIALAERYGHSWHESF
ncbi:MAG TPA: glucose-6-phosphate dehydrogenase [Gammaproteobacteria bacterium]|nr:glucose-6-phosphate dehydrogenase [Gammaproteobacteria bacterium]